MVDVPVVKTPQQTLQGDTVSLLAVVKTLLALVVKDLDVDVIANDMSVHPAKREVLVQDFF